MCVAALLLIGTGCVSPAFNADTYRSQALESIVASESELQTTRIVLGSMLGHRIFQTTADEVVSGAESALSSVTTSFGAVQPPGDAVQLERRMMRYLTNAQDAVTGARIAIRQGDAVAMRLAYGRVQHVLDRADLLSESLR